MGIEAELLVPFAYFGLKDEVDYRPENIPWRNQRFDPEALARAVQTQERMEQLWRAWQAHPGTRTLVFCCSIRHAVFVRDWLEERGLRVAAVFSAPGSADRTESLEALRDGSLDAICSVDVFNEGVDVPSVDRVVLLRPTESPVVFIQQLGRGLRRAESAGKRQLTVIDFVGNHRIFLNRVRTLLSLAGATISERRLIEEHRERLEAPELPPGCSVEIELEALQLLEKLLPRGANKVEEAYLELYARRGTRPTVGELFRNHLNPATLRQAGHASWFDFVNSHGHLLPEEVAAFEQGRAWFEALEVAPMVKSFKMVVLEVLLEEGALFTGMSVETLAQRSHDLLLRSPELFHDLEDVQALPDPRAPEPAQWLRYWRGNPIKAWTSATTGSEPWFRVEGERIVFQVRIAPEHEEAFANLTRELVDYQLARYRRRSAEDQVGESFECRLISNDRDPILKLPSRTKRPDLPEGELDVRLPRGDLWQFRLKSQFCNVARPVGTSKNQLPDLLRSWFGPSAGMPGTYATVRFSRSPDGWWIEPVGAKVLPLASRGKITAFPTLRAAAGAAEGALLDLPEAEQVTLPVRVRGEGLFAVRADGDSMDGGKQPIRDGDWLVLRYARGAALGAVEGRVALVQTMDPTDGLRFQLKRVVREDDRWRLRSDNPKRESFDAGPDSVPVALLEQVIRPEELGPEVGAILSEEELSQGFGLQTPLKSGRVEGHLFVMLEDASSFVAPDRLRWPATERRPGETLFVLLRQGDARWRYCGVGSWSGQEDRWLTPAFDFKTWRAISDSRSCSRTLPAEAEARARSFVIDLLARHPLGTWVEAGGRRFQLNGPAPQGGVRIKAGSEESRDRTISLADLGWSLLARDQTGGPVDEVAVNRLRYIEGTPKDSTRWIDTGWALCSQILDNARKSSDAYCSCSTLAARPANESKQRPRKSGLRGRKSSYPNQPQNGASWLSRWAVDSSSTTPGSQQISATLPHGYMDNSPAARLVFLGRGLPATGQARTTSCSPSTRTRAPPSENCDSRSIDLQKSPRRVSISSSSTR